MSIFGRRDRRPSALEWGSSFAEAEVATKRRGRGRFDDSAYDARIMASQPPTDHDRPIGSRRHDIVRPEAFGSTPPPTRRRTLGQRLASVVLLFAALLLVGGLVWTVLNFSGLGGSDVKPGQKVHVTIPKGATSTDVADVLAKAGVVNNETVFRARLKLNGDGAGFRAGSYTMKTGSSYDTVVKTLEKGPAAAPTFQLQVIEGQRLEEIAASFDAKRSAAQRAGTQILPAFTGAEYLKAVRALRPDPALKAPAGTKSMEGLLFPATYDLRLTATASDFVAKQQDAFRDNLADIDMTRAAKANLTPYDVVTIASLIEREAKLDKERPLVAAVIWNRLKVGEPLGIDASNQYSVYQQGSKVFWEPELKQSQLDLDSAYNLRKVAGLPPTPIAAPSLKSLQAAANPANVDYRYYVLDTKKNDGSHFFTADYDEFLAHQ
jgi:uncharacterized YceG family protein